MGAFAGEVAEGIHRLTQGVANFYLVEQGGKFTLVDAGAPKDWDLLVRAIAGLGRTMEDLDAILLTHAHPDHIGFAERARATAGAPVWIHEADAPVAQGAKRGRNDGRITSYLFRPAFYRTTISLVRRGGAKIVPVHEVSTFGEDETLDVPGRPRVIHAPGHTSGTSALLVEDRRALLSGDALVTWNALTGRMGPQIMPSGLNRDTDQAMRSLDTIESVDAEVLLPGHGDPWTQGAKEAVRLARLAGPS